MRRREICDEGADEKRRSKSDWPSPASTLESESWPRAFTTGKLQMIATKNKFSRESQRSQG
jgi:hypothetical protein